MAGEREQDDDDRVRAAWRSWLSALATDAEAAMAAALAYESLPAEGRDAWLDALDSDAPGLGVPRLALYAPLMAVETDTDRRDRMEGVLAADVACGSEAPDPTALHGVGGDGTHACVIIAPLYLEFVQVLACRYTPTGGFVAVKHEPLRHVGELGRIGDVDGVPVEPAPLRVVVEELAHAILADKREHRTTPVALTSFAHLFAPTLEDSEDSAPPR
ncbi:MAG TPA: hypothetical protein VGG39_30650 [Polyangiaceae bacterium]|jgi:hypothetical protein